ncbi:MAG: peptide-methionine (S)-S-oxide reductase MsrA [Gammaproteobacteria bacterium]|nr:peptide-methionine (S)-S-oxide reductase MsrA [Gammaproteobacteria bacterium]
MVKRILFFCLLLLTATAHAQENLQTAIFAGGCFWCVESDFDRIKGVKETLSGYTGGQVKNPSYEQVSAGGTGHVEAVKVIYDANQISYAQLLEKFWRSIDPTTPNQQFCDHGAQYRSEIFYLNDEQKQAATRSKHALQQNKPFAAAIVTAITPASEFYPAEGYHQNYYQKNPLRYKYYRYRCGRDQRLQQLWGDNR